MRNRSAVPLPFVVVLIIAVLIIITHLSR